MSGRLSSPAEEVALGLQFLGLVVSVVAVLTTLFAWSVGRMPLAIVGIGAAAAGVVALAAGHARYETLSPEDGDD